MKLFSIFSFLSIFLIALIPTLDAQNNAESNIFTLDTRTGVYITGQVVGDGSGHGIYTPISSVVSVNGKDYQTSGNGLFAIKTPLETRQVIRFEAEEFIPKEQTLEAMEDGESFDVGTIVLAELTDDPFIESIKIYPDYSFLYGTGSTTEVRGVINWQGHTPSKVILKIDGNVVDEKATDSSEIKFEVNIDSTFGGGSELPHQVQLIAEALSKWNGEPIQSDPSVRYMNVYALPACLEPFSGLMQIADSNVAFELNLSGPESMFNLPVLSMLGLDFPLGGRFDYAMDSAQWEVQLGSSAERGKKKFARRPSLPGVDTFKTPRLFLGNKELNIELSAGVSGSAFPGEGIRAKEISAAFSFDARLELARYTPFGLVSGAQAKIIRGITGDAFLNNFSIGLEAIPSIVGGGKFELEPSFKFGDAELEVGIGLEASYKPQLSKSLNAAVVLGGSIKGTVGLPEDPVFRKLNCKGYLKLSAKAWVLEASKEFVFLDYTIPAKAAAYSISPIFAFDMVLVDDESGQNDWSPMERNWRKSEQAASVKLVAADAVESSDFPSVSNIFTNSSHCLAENGQELMHVYVRDNNASNPLQFTEIAYTHFDGVNWTGPAPLYAESNAQFSPQVAFDGAGNGIAVFERVKDANMADGTIEEFAAEMEIVWSQFDADTQSWSAPVTLTNNSVLDKDPQLSGRLADGDLFLTWTRNSSNQIHSSSETPSEIWVVRWDSITSSWSSPSLLIDSVTLDLGNSLSVGGTNGVFVWSVDLDNDASTITDTELYYRSFDSSEWQPAVRMTNNNVSDLNPKCKMYKEGTPFVVWAQETQMVSLAGYSGVPNVISDEAGSMTLGEYALAGGDSSSDNIALMWQEMSEHGSDVHLNIYDHSSSTWGVGSILSNDLDMEYAFAPVWNSEGDIVFAYLNTVISLETVEVDIGSGLISVDHFPVDGQVDLRFAKHCLEQNLCWVADSLETVGESFDEGQTVTLKGNIFNSGDLPLRNFLVRFYNGDPSNGGTLIHSEQVADWLRSKDVREISCSWTLPNFDERKAVYAVVDSGDVIVESSESDNTIQNEIGVMDLVVSKITGQLMTDKSVRLNATVQNIGTQSSPATDIQISKTIPEAESVVLATQMIGRLEPGDSREVIFNLSAGIHDLRSIIYEVVVDSESSLKDIDRNDNSAFLLLKYLSDDALDYNGDDNIDLIWQNTTNGSLVLWAMNGNGRKLSTTVLSDGTGTGSFVGSGDVNGDFNTDLIFLSSKDAGYNQAEIWFNNGAGSYASKKKLSPIGIQWRLAAVGDLNEDGFADLLWQHKTSGRVSVWYMNQNGNLSSSAVLVSSIDDWMLVGVADLDGDEHEDLIWQREVGASVQIAVWNLDGEGVKTSSSVFATVGGTEWCVVGLGDFNSDEHVDVLLQSKVSGKLAAWFYNGALQRIGTQVLSSDAANWRVGHMAREETSIYSEENDIDGDGNADLIWQNMSNNALTCWSMDGAGRQSSKKQLSSGLGTGMYVDCGDVNQDGDLDLLFLKSRDSSTHYAEIWFNDGSGSYSQKKKHGAIGTEWKLVGLGDINGDSVPDLVWQNGDNGRVTVWHLDKDGNKTSGAILVEFIVDWKLVSIADMNADENQDLIWQKSTGGVTQISVWHLNGIGKRVSHDNIVTLADTEWQLVGVADYNEDSYFDILLQNRINGKLVCWLLNGNYQKTAAQALSGAIDNWRIGHWSWSESSNGVERNDFDGDGHADLFWQNLNNDVVSCWQLNGSGFRISATQLANGVANDRLVGIADMNADEVQDLVFLQAKSASIHHAEVWYGDGSGGLSGSRKYGDISTDWKLVGLGDLNDDKIEDFVWEHVNNGRVSVWYLDAAGKMSSSNTIVSWIADWRVAAVADLNTDGQQDLVWQRTNGSLTQLAVWYLNGNGVRTGSAIVASLPDANWKLVGIADYNADDQLDFLWQHAVTGKLVCWELDGSLRRSGKTVLSGSINGWRVAHWGW